MKLTVELVEGAAQYIHPATKDRELDLRGYKIPAIENMGATRDQFDSIDLTDNEIKKLENFPLLKRVTKLLLSNNRISRIGDGLHESLPSLSWLILTNNEITELADIDSLSSLSQLSCLSLINNPIATKADYRLYVIHRLPQLRLLDFRRIRRREREEANKLFSGKKGKILEQEIRQKVSTFVPGEELAHSKPQKRSPAEVLAIKKAIEKATTLDEVQRLKQQLNSGSFDPHVQQTVPQTESQDEPMEQT